MTYPQTAALTDLLERVDAGECCTIPTPHPGAKDARFNKTARIMGYCEHYVMMRHRLAAPFCMSRNDVMRHLRALIADTEGQ